MLVDHAASRLATGDPVVAVVVTLGPILVVLLLSLRRNAQAAFMDRPSTDALKGLAALGVVIHHIYYWVGEMPDALPILSLTGQLGVAVFLGLSGFGLQVSYRKRRLERQIQGRPIRFASAVLLSLALAYSTGAMIRGLPGVAVPILLTVYLLTFARHREPLLTDYLLSRLSRLYVLVILIGAFGIAGLAISGAQPPTTDSVIRALTGTDVWFVQYLLTWYIAFALSWVIPERLRVGAMFAWALVWSLAMARAGLTYPAEFGLAFPAGCLLANLVEGGRRERTLGVACQLGLAVTALFLAMLVVRPGLAVTARTMLLGGLGTPTVGATFAWPWLPLARLIPSLVVVLAACGLSLLAARARVRSPLLEFIGRCSLAAYLQSRPAGALRSRHVPGSAGCHAVSCHRTAAHARCGVHGRRDANTGLAPPQGLASRFIPLREVRTNQLQQRGPMTNCIRRRRRRSSKVMARDAFGPWTTVQPRLHLLSSSALGRARGDA